MVKKARTNYPFSSVLFLLFTLVLLSTPAYSQKTTLITKNITESQKQYEIKALYPQMEIPNDALMGVRGMIADFNSPIDTLVIYRITEFKEFVKSIRIEDEKRKSQLGISAKTISDSKNIFSLRLETFSDVDFAAHPNTLYDSYNFNYELWTPFTLKDIFLENSAYLKFISDFCKADLKKQFPDTDGNVLTELEKGASGDEKNFQTFNVSGDALIITFQYYQLGPRMLGAPQVSVPLVSLKEMINPAGPLGFYIKK